MDFIKYNTYLFTDVYESVDLFKADYGAFFPKTITDDNYSILFYLLYSKYGNNPIANDSVIQFKIKLQSIVWQYGSTWEKKLDIQKILRELQEADLVKGTTNDYTVNGNTNATNTANSKNLQSHAVGPGELGAVINEDDGSLLNYINDQVATKNENNQTNTIEDTKTSNQKITKSKMDAYTQLWNMLDADATNEFIERFNILFKTVVAEEDPYVYINYIE